MAKKHNRALYGEKKDIEWNGGAFRGCEALIEVDLYSAAEKSSRELLMEKIMGDPYVITPSAEWLKLFAETAFFRKAQIQNKRCTYCGGQFTGLLSKTCIECGRPKDY